MSKNISKYLDKLEYDKNLEKWFIAFLLKRFRLLFLLIFVIIIAWIIGLKSLPLESTPEINIWVWVVTVVLPWATPETIEDLITKKLEKEISKIKGLDTITSTSLNSMSMIQVQFKSSTDTKTAIRDLKDKVDLAKAKFPSDTKEPIVKEVSFSDTPIWTFAISWNYTWRELYKYAQKIQEKLEQNSLISEANITGWEQIDFEVSIDPRKLESFWLTLDNVNNVIKSNNITIPIWSYDIGNFTHNINIDSRFYDTSSLSNLIVAKQQDSLIYLKDIATITEKSKKKTSMARLWTTLELPKNSVTIWVVKKSGWSIVNLIDEWLVALDELKKTNILPNDLKITTVVDQSERIKLDQHHLIRDWLITVLLVFIVLFLIIWIKEALVAWLAAPIVFLMTFVIMDIAGQTLNFLSMFALILSLWLLVDDAIVIISAMNQYKKTGKFTTYQCALLVVRDYKRVVISTTLTVVWIFSAMLFMTGIIGKFIFSIPFIITVTLLCSLLVAFTLNPALSVFFNRNEYKNKDKKESFLDKWLINIEPIQNLYERVIQKLIWNKKLAKFFLIFIFILFVSSIALIWTWVVKSDFFPKTDQDTIFVNVETEIWTNLETTSLVMEDLEKIVSKEKEVKSYAVNIWWLAVVWNSAWAWIGSSNYASLTINLIKRENWRKESSMSIADRLRSEVKNFKNAKVTIVELAWWPPAWADFEMKIAWEDFNKLEKIWNDIKKTLSKIPWVVNITSSRKPLPLELRFTLDPMKLEINSLNIWQVSMFIKNSVDWIDPSKVYIWNDEILIKTKYEDSSTDTLDKIKDLKIKNTKWQYVYLRDVMNIDLKKSVFSITRFNQKRVLTISAWADKSTNWTNIKKEFDKKMLGYKLPDWYEFITGWANEENQKSIMSLWISMIFWLLFVMWTLVVLFDSYKQSFLVLITIPLSLIWVFYGLALFNQPLSFPWMIWLVALFWIVVRNWIILFDKINQNLDENIEFVESIVDAWKSRLEPVLLTSVCTILWMVPLTLSNPTWTSLWLSIICWLFVATFLTLLVLPTLYYMFVKRR